MDLELQEVAGLLQVSESQLLHWAEAGKVPAYFINDQYRFNRQEIEAWVLREQQDASSGTDEKEGQKQAGSLKFNLFRALNNGAVFADIEGETKAEIIKNVMKRLAPQLRLDPDVLTELFLDREQLMSTAVGAGLAIPHARDFLLHGHRDVVAVVFLRQPIDYDALDGEKVHTLFFLLASDDKRHLALLSKIAHLTSSKAMKEALMKKLPKSELLECVKEWESQLT
jgi:nitrogen PTS system EIIA component